MKNYLSLLNNNKGYAAIPLVMGLGGSVLGGAIGGPIGATIGYVIGSALGAYFFPTQTEEGTLETSTDIQNASVGIPVPIIYGTRRVAGNIIWVGALHPYTPEYDKKDSKGGGSGGGKTVEGASMYRRSFLIGICQGPATVSRMWAGKDAIALSNATLFKGDGNSGLDSIDGGYKYKDLCCAFFEEYDLGSSTAIPNFNFEVMQGSADWKVFTPPSGSFSWYKCTAFYENKLYIGTYDDGFVYRYDGDSLWTDISKPGGFGQSVKKLVVYNNKLYALTPASYIYRYDGGTTWTNIDSPLPTFCSPEDAIVYDNKLFVGYVNSDQTKVSYYNESGWTYAGQVSNAHAGSIRLCVFSGNLYAGTGYSNASMCHTYRYESGTTWTDLGQVGSEFIGVGDLAVWNDNLYVAVKHSSDGNLDAVFRFDGEDNWSSIGAAPRISTLFIFNEDFYGGTGNGYVYRYEGGTSWSAISPQLRVLAIAVLFSYNSRLYATSGINIYYYDLVENANPADVIKDLLTNTKYGAAVPAEYIDDDFFASVKSYCDTMGYLFSFAVNSQKALLDWIDYICSHFKGYLTMDGAKIKLGVFKDEDSLGDITQNDLVVEGDTPPVSIKKREYKDTYNRVSIEWIDRDNDYEKATAVANDEVDQRIAKNIRSRKIQLNGIMTSALAGEWAYRYLADSLYRYSFYSFTVGYKDMVIQPGNVRVLNDGYSISDMKIRITSVNETKDGKNLSIEAVEDMPNLYGVYNYSVSENKWTPPVAPDLLSPVAKFIENIHLEHIKIALVPQDAKATGFLVYRSYDDSTYKMIGFCGQTGTAGSLTTGLTAEKSIMYKPTQYFEVDVGAQGSLISVDEEDFLSNRSVCRIGDEFIAFQTVELIAGGVKKYRVSKLIRGIYNTKPVAHAIDSEFILYQNAYKYTYEKDEIGKTVYFKFLTVYGKWHQELANVSAQSHLVVGQYYRPAPATLIRIKDRAGMEKYSGANVTLAWNICAKNSGYGSGGYGSIGYGSYVADAELENMILRIEKENGDLLEEKILAKNDVEEEITPTETTIVAKVIPARDIRDLREESITITKI